MKKIIVFSILFLIGCQEENVEPTPATCNCYQRHETLSSNLGQFTWVHDYDTNPIPELCEKDNGVWIDDGTAHRYRYICE